MVYNNNECVKDTAITNTCKNIGITVSNYGGLKQMDSKTKSLLLKSMAEILYNRQVISEDKYKKMLKEFTNNK